MNAVCSICTCLQNKRKPGAVQLLHDVLPLRLSVPGYGTHHLTGSAGSPPKPQREA